MGYGGADGTRQDLGGWGPACGRWRAKTRQSSMKLDLCTVGAVGLDHAEQ